MSDERRVMDTIERRLDQHDERLRSLERVTEVLPRIEGKLDTLISQDHGRDLAVLQAREEARDGRIAELGKDLDRMREDMVGIRDTVSKWSVPIGILILVVTLAAGAALLGVQVADLSAEPILSETLPHP